jgi:hypothetical protein
MTYENRAQVNELCDKIEKLLKTRDEIDNINGYTLSMEIQFNVGRYFLNVDSAYDTIARKALAEIRADISQTIESLKAQLYSL